MSIDINTATLEELGTLKGIKDELARAIVNTRPFQQVEDLLDIPGIGPRKLASLVEQGIHLGTGADTEGLPTCHALRFDLVSRFPVTVLERDVAEQPALQEALGNLHALLCGPVLNITVAAHASRVDLDGAEPLSILRRGAQQTLLFHTQRRYGRSLKTEREESQQRAVPRASGEQASSGESLAYHYRVPIPGLDGPGGGEVNLWVVHRADLSASLIAELYEALFDGGVDASGLAAARLVPIRISYPVDNLAPIESHFEGYHEIDVPDTLFDVPPGWVEATARIQGKMSLDEGAPLAALLEQPLSIAGGESALVTPLLGTEEGIGSIVEEESNEGSAGSRGLALLASAGDVGMILDASFFAKLHELLGKIATRLGTFTGKGPEIAIPWLAQLEGQPQPKKLDFYTLLEALAQQAAPGMIRDAVAAGTKPADIPGLTEDERRQLRIASSWDAFLADNKVSGTRQREIYWDYFRTTIGELKFTPIPYSPLHKKAVGKAAPLRYELTILKWELKFGNTNPLDAFTLKDGDVHSCLSFPKVHVEADVKLEADMDEWYNSLLAMLTFGGWRVLTNNDLRLWFWLDMALGFKLRPRYHETVTTAGKKQTHYDRLRLGIERDQASSRFKYEWVGVGWNLINDILLLVFAALDSMFHFLVADQTPAIASQVDGAFRSLGLILPEWFHVAGMPVDVQPDATWGTDKAHPSLLLRAGGKPLARGEIIATSGKPIKPLSFTSQGHYSLVLSENWLVDVLGHEFEQRLGSSLELPLQWQNVLSEPLPGHWVKPQPAAEGSGTILPGVVRWSNGIDSGFMTVTASLEDIADSDETSFKARETVLHFEGTLDMGEDRVVAKAGDPHGTLTLRTTVQVTNVFSRRVMTAMMGTERPATGAARGLAADVREALGWVRDRMGETVGGGEESPVGTDVSKGVRVVNTYQPREYKMPGEKDTPDPVYTTVTMRQKLFEVELEAGIPIQVLLTPVQLDPQKGLEIKLLPQVQIDAGTPAVKITRVMTCVGQLPGELGDSAAAWRASLEDTVEKLIRDKVFGEDRLLRSGGTHEIKLLGYLEILGLLCLAKLGKDASDVSKLMDCMIKLEKAYDNVSNRELAFRMKRGGTPLVRVAGHCLYLGFELQENLSELIPV